MYIHIQYYIYIDIYRNRRCTRRTLWLPQSRTQDSVRRRRASPLYIISYIIDMYFGVDPNTIHIYRNRLTINGNLHFRCTRPILRLPQSRAHGSAYRRQASARPKPTVESKPNPCEWVHSPDSYRR